jgi:hypothetical protein
VVPASLTFLYSFLYSEPIRVGIHICLETAQEISLYSYLYLKLAKTSCFSFYLLLFLSYKIGEQVGLTGSAQWEGVWWHLCEVAGDRESGRRMNMMQITYTHVCKCKRMIPVETVPGIGSGRVAVCDER